MHMHAYSSSYLDSVVLRAGHSQLTVGRYGTAGDGVLVTSEAAKHHTGGGIPQLHTDNVTKQQGNVLLHLDQHHTWLRQADSMGVH